MISFNEILLEDKGGKNLHLEHLEDEILNYGVDGGRAALNFLRSLRDMFLVAASQAPKPPSRPPTMPQHHLPAPLPGGLPLPLPSGNDSQTR